MYGHPGFVPDQYLAGRGSETTITAAELCAAGMWEHVERVDGGYRVLDQDAVDVCVSLSVMSGASDGGGPAPR